MNAIIVSAIMGVVMMFGGILFQNKSTLRLLSIAGLLILIAANLLQTYGIFTVSVDVKGLLSFERFGLYFNTICFVATLLYVLLSARDMEQVGNYTADYHALIFFVLTGVSILTSFNSLLMLFLGVEIMTIPLFILTGSDKRNLKSNEAALKYFLMGSFSTGILLMGIALVYGANGNFNLVAVRASFLGGKASFLEIGGMLLIFVAMAFKVSAAPFHFWTPDVYDGAPSVFTAFMATVVKAAGFFAFLRIFLERADVFGPTWKIVLAIVIIATLLIGNITAVFQQSVKRMLAYSSIAQAGFMLFALWSMNDMAKEGLILYAVAYSLATVGIFAVLIKMKDYTFDGFNGLAKSEPLVALAATIFLLSLAGIPLTAGFFAKYFMLASVVKAGGAIWLVVVAVLFAAVSVYYYFRVIQSMYFKDGQPETAPLSSGFRFMLGLVAALVILVGVAPSTVLGWFYF